MLHSFFGRPITALRPMFGIERVLERPRLVPALQLDHARRAVDQVGGHPAVEEIRRLDQVIVDGDHRERPWSRFWVREQ